MSDTSENRKPIEEDFETPRTGTGVISRRNLLAALTGSDVALSGGQQSLVGNFQLQQASNLKLTLSVADQKRAQERKMEQHRLDKLMENLIDRRDLINDKMLRIQDSLSAPTEFNIHYLNLQLESIRRCYSEFDSIHTQMCDIAKREDKADLRSEYLNFEQLHEILYVKIQTLIANIQQGVPGRALASNTNTSDTLSRLQIASTVPHLQVPLPTFDGKLENWYSFKCMFQTIMNRYPNESPAIKLYHLKNSLIGSAAGKIDQDVINNNNYESAWKMLEDSYEDERLIIDTHIDALLDLPKVTKENGDELRKLLEICTKHIDALKNRQLPVEGLSEMILVNIVCKRMDRESRKLWESSLSREELPVFCDLLDFIKERSRVLLKLSNQTYQVQQQPAVKVKQPRIFVQTNKDGCACCAGAHSIYRCAEFKGLPVRERYERVKKGGLCFNCLRQGHRTVDCKVDRSCQACGKHHHSLLHQHSERLDIPARNNTKPDIVEPISNEKKQDEPEERRTVNCCMQVQPLAKQFFLSTAVVQVSGSRNKTVFCRALLDCCSESNIITKRLAAKLNMKPMIANTPIVICGLNNMTTTTNKFIQTKVSSRNGEFSAMLDFLITPTITELPTGKVDTHLWPLPPAVELADPTFNDPADVDMIIGAEIYYDILKKGRLKIGADFPTLAETVFGWVVSGPAKLDKPGVSKRMCQLNITFEDVNQTLSRFWELETCYKISTLTKAEQAIEKHFETTHSRNIEGRYIVRIPFNERKDLLGDSMEHAKQRFGKLLSSFSRNPKKKEQYTEFMDEYLALGHMKEVYNEPEQCYYLPHHAVYKNSSSTTKLRVVFDASAATTSGLSLNDTQQVGPTVQNDLVTIIMRFCTHQVVLTADIPKMYRQVQVDEADRKFQRILWLNKKGEWAKFELATVTYGCSSAPYLATRALMQLAVDEANEFPVASRVIKEDSYIDDFLTGASTTTEVIEIVRQLEKMLNRGGFGVHKFCSNSAEVLEVIPVDLQEKRMEFENCDINDAIRTLGLIWHPGGDYFVFDVPPLGNQYSIPTKRIVLSEIGRLFDPLGFLGPVVTLAKLTMQDLWRLQLNWDEVLPEDQMANWLTFREQLVLVRNIRKMRCVIPCDAQQLELHGFCDASRRAYGACLYIRSVTVDGSISVRLVCSKSRVSPLKPVTIPRLELCGALVLAQLVQKTIQAIKLNFASITLWTDSQIVLSWLKKPPMSLNEFVRNRVACVVELTQNFQWQYVKSENNPADALSRGQLPEHLLTNQLWWNGSPELRDHEIPDHSTVAILNDQDLPEMRDTKCVLTTVQQRQPFTWNRVSDFRRLQHAWVYVWRFITIIRTKSRVSGPFTVAELTQSSHTVYKLVQQEVFADLLKELKAGSLKRNKLSGLAPFLDHEGLIRVGGRLKYSAIPYEGRHQILLPQKHPVTEMVIRHLHTTNLHVGLNGLLSTVRQELWPIGARMIIKRVVGHCYQCFKQNPKQIHQFMGDLPSYRVTPSPVFTKIGVDYAGPFVLKEGGRKPKYYKAYVAVFICMAVKAVHLELVTDMRTETFLGALQRFVGRRGYPSDIFSDNGTTFVGANHELAALREMFENQQTQMKLNEFCNSKGIMWHFIPPRSPHFGGIWEAGVKTMKYHLKRVVGETRLTYEEMTTFLIEVEAIMNSRPLTPLSDDPNDLEALTPSHFLLGRLGKVIPEPSYNEEKVGRLSRWQHVQLMREHLWRRWSTDYLHNLQSRQKWKDGVVDVKIGSLILMRDENLPPQQWRLGRIIATKPGKDGIVRVVSIKTASGEFVRALTKICIFPVLDCDESTGGE